MQSLSSWRARGVELETRDGRVFVVDVPGGAATPVLALHGFPTASWDFAGAIARIAPSRRVVTFDFLGFGFSEKPEVHGYSLFEQADVAIAVARARGLSRVHLLAHDMGTSVATELLARRERGLLPLEIASLVLMNGSVHVDLASLTIGQRLLRTPLGPTFARLSTRRTFAAQIRRLFSTPPGDAEIDAMWELVSRDDGAKRMPALVRYLEERWRFRRRWIGALERLDLPTLVAWGERDPVAVMAIARALVAEIPGARLVTFPALGHWPAIEDPARVVSALLPFWAALDEPARAPA